MPLKITLGIIITPAALSPAAATLLNVPYFRQEQTNWCWAACCEMVFHYYNVNNIRQCDMATVQFGGHCCETPSSSTCNRGNWPDNTYPHYGFHFSKLNNAISLAATQSEIRAKRPVEVYYAWTGGGAHVAIVRGFYDNGDLEVNDPWYGPGRRAYSFVLSAYGLGRWTITYTNLWK